MPLSKLKALFFYQKPLWRSQRYQLTIDSLKQSLHRFSLGVDDVQKRLQPIDSKLKQLTLKPFKILSATSSNSRKQYYAFITALRTALKSAEYKAALDSPSAQVLRQLSEVLFTSITLDPFCTELVDNVAAAGGITEEEGDLFADLRRIRQAIVAAPTSIKTSKMRLYLQAFRGHINFRYDPYLQENTPYLHYLLPVKQGLIPSLRLGTPTIEKVFSSLRHHAEVSPEFCAFMEKYRREGRRHLYINMQNRSPKAHGFTEAARCRALEKLADQFPDTFLIMTLGKNSDFYWQEGPYRPIEEAQQFKALFKEALRSQDGGFFVAPSLLNSRFFPFEETIDELLKNVHKKFFKENKQLSHQERLDFIELFYTLLIERCIEAAAVDSYNITCRDGIDRAGGGNALLYLYKQKTVGALEHKALKTILFAPALLVKKRAISEKRFKRFLSAAEQCVRQKNDNRHTSFFQPSEPGAGHSQRERPL